MFVLRCSKGYLKYTDDGLIEVVSSAKDADKYPTERLAKNFVKVFERKNYRDVTYEPHNG